MTNLYFLSLGFVISAAITMVFTMFVALWSGTDMVLVTVNRFNESWAEAIIFSVATVFAFVVSLRRFGAECIRRRK